MQFDYYWSYDRYYLASYKLQLQIIFFGLLKFNMEEDANRDFSQNALKDIRRLLLAYVKDVVFRPLLASGGLAIDYKKAKDERIGLKICIIYIKCDMDPYNKIETFVHEMIHVKQLEYGVSWIPNEERLDKLAIDVTKQHYEKIKILLDEYLDGTGSWEKEQKLLKYE